MFKQLTFGEMAGYFQIETESRQVVTNQIVQFASNAHTLCYLAAVYQQLLSCAEFRVQLGQLVSGYRFACGCVRHEHGKHLKAKPRHAECQRDFQREMRTDHET